MHSIANAIAVEDAAEDPDRYLVLGPSRAGNMLEVIVLVNREGDEIVIHAMPMRPIYRRLLEQ